MAFQQGLSGLASSSKALDVASNNIANASTVGFKSSNSHFADVYGASLQGGGGSQIGIGSTLSAVMQQYTQGNITATNNPLDIAINGTGFFGMTQNGAVSYTRNGQFHLDKNGYIVNDQNRKLLGVLANTAGTIPQQPPTDMLKVEFVTGKPNPTTTAAITANVDSRQKPPTQSSFSATDTDSYNSSTAMTVYDSLGNPHTMSYYFVKTTTPNQWDLYTRLDGTAINTASNPTDASGRQLFTATGTPIAQLTQNVTKDALGNEQVAYINGVSTDGTGPVISTFYAANNPALSPANLASSSFPVTSSIASPVDASGNTIYRDAAQTQPVGPLTISIAADGTVSYSDSSGSALTNFYSGSPASLKSFSPATLASSYFPVTKTISTPLDSTGNPIYSNVGSPQTQITSLKISVAADGTVSYQDMTGGGAGTSLSSYYTQSVLSSPAMSAFADTLSFTTSGTLSSIAPHAGGAAVLDGVIPQQFLIGTGAVTPLDFSVNLSNMTQFGSPFAVNDLTQNGFAPGNLAGVSVSKDGIVQARYDNGQTRDIGQVALFNFRNANGLVAIGNNQWTETADSGQPTPGNPNSGIFGVLQSSAIEESNVDLTAELVNLIVQQRNYQASAQSIKTQDQVMQTLVNIR